MADASCGKTYCEERFQIRVVILREIDRDLGNIPQRFVTDTSELERFVKCDWGPSNYVVYLSQRRQDEDAAAPERQVGHMIRKCGSVGSSLHE